MKFLKPLVIVFTVLIVVLVGILLFVPAAKGPTGPAVSADGRLAVTKPSANDLVTSPAAVRGTVTGGGWFFEASFPVKILDGDGSVLGQAPVQATGDWMTTGTVPFTGSIAFTAPKYATGTIVFEKDNPSGLPQNAGELRLPVRFK